MFSPHCYCVVTNVSGNDDMCVQCARVPVPVFCVSILLHCVICII